MGIDSCKYISISVNAIILGLLLYRTATLVILPMQIKRTYHGKSTSSPECKALKCGFGHSSSAPVPDYIACLPHGKRPPAGLPLQTIVTSDLSSVVSRLALGSVSLLAECKLDRITLEVEVRPSSVLLPLYYDN